MVILIITINILKMQPIPVSSAILSHEERSVKTSPTDIYSKITMPRKGHHCTNETLDQQGQIFNGTTMHKLLVHSAYYDPNDHANVHVIGSANITITDQVWCKFHHSKTLGAFFYDFSNLN